MVTTRLHGTERGYRRDRMKRGEDPWGRTDVRRGGDPNRQQILEDIGGRSGQFTGALSGYSGLYGVGVTSRTGEHLENVGGDWNESDFAISEDLSQLHEVFSAAYNPDLASKAVGGQAIYSMYEGRLYDHEEISPGRYTSRAVGHMWSSSVEDIRRDEPTFRALLRSERSRRTAFVNSFFDYGF